MGWIYDAEDELIVHKMDQLIYEGVGSLLKSKSLDIYQP